MHDDQRRIAFEILYAENATPVYRFALRLCGNRDDAEDITAEAFAQAFRKLGEYRSDSSQRTWLCAIVLNQWRMRKRKNQVPEDRLESLRQVASSFKFEDFELAEALSTLSDPLREAFLLVKGEGFTHAEAAKALRVPVGTMYFRVHTAVRQLRGLLGSKAWEVESQCEVPLNHEM